jgi:hypothetical protein
VALLPACGPGEPALSVSDVGYAEEEILGLDHSRKLRLAEITAFGLAVARGETEELGSPVNRRISREALLNLLERDLRLDFAGIGEDVLKRRYAADPKYELTVRHLVVLADEFAPEEAAEAARATARAALERIRAGEAFPDVAGEVSEEPGARERGGLLEPGREGTWVDEFWAAASALDLGEVSPVIRTPYGFHVLRLEDREVIPFEEARHWVIDRVAREVPPMRTELRRWSDSVKASVDVDSASLVRGFEEAGALLPLVTRGFHSRRPDSVVARWPGGSFTAGELRTFLLGMDFSDWEYVALGGGGPLAEMTRDAAGQALLEEIAEERALSVTPEIEAALNRGWETMVARSAATLGFREGMTPAQVKVRSMEAFRESGQGARIARNDLHQWSHLLRAFYPVEPALHLTPSSPADTAESGDAETGTGSLP